VLIKRILIITEHGVPIFDYEEYGRDDEVLVGGLLTAILKFVEETEQDKLSRLLLEESQFLVISKESLIFIFQISDEMPGEYAEYVSSCIFEKFMQKYSDQLKEFRGNVSLFQDFQEGCKEILLECGANLADVLINEKESQNLRAWCLLSMDYEPLIVMANAPKYNVDSFTIFQVLGKSVKKVSSKLNDHSTANAFHITHNGNIVQTIILPQAIILTESHVEDLKAKSIRQLKTKTAQQLTNTFTKIYKPDSIEVFSKSMISTTTQKEMDENQKVILDLFKAAEKGFQYLFDSPTHIQILNFDDKSYIYVKLINRSVIMEFNRKVSISTIIENTKKAFEEITIPKADTPAAVLER
jgi:hypothetical protein